VDVQQQHPLQAMLVDLLRDQLVEELPLPRLSRTETASLLELRSGSVSFAARWAEAIHARTAGNPFFITELVKTLIDQHSPLLDDEGPAARLLSEIAMPRSIRAVVDQRVGRLPEPVRDLLTVAAVLGQEWDLAVLLGAVQQDEATALDALESALAARLLEERPGAHTDQYAFVHALIAQTLYAALPRHRARLLHGRVGAALVRLHGTEPDAAAEIARHFAVSGDPRAVAYAERAGDRAAGLCAHAEAVAQFELAIRLTAAGEERPAAAPLWQKLGRELHIMGRYAEALAALRRLERTSAPEC
jgi:predicted ATPase